MRNISTETGMIAIPVDHNFLVLEDFVKAVIKVVDSKKLEFKVNYKPVFITRFLVTALQIVA